MKIASLNFVAAIVAALIVVASASSGMAQPRLFTTMSTAQRQAADSSHAPALDRIRSAPTTRAVELVRADPSVLNGAVILDLPELGAMTANRRQTFVRSGTDYTWVGDVQSTVGKVIFVVRDGDITGQIQINSNLYTITPLGGGMHALATLDQGKFPPDHRPGPLPVAPKEDGRQGGSAPAQPDTAAAAAAGGVEVDVLIAYTPAARTAYTGQIASLAQLAVDDANSAYSASNANVSLRLVGTMEVAYTEAAGVCNNQNQDVFGKALCDLSRGNGVMSSVHSRRDQVGADLVSLFVADTTWCGLATVNSTASSAFSVVAQSCAVGNHSFAHELGHNFGANHDPYVEPSNTPFAHGHGYVKPTWEWRTVMAYVNECRDKGTTTTQKNCPRIGYFSNPSVSYQGSATGTATRHDVARVHRERAATVAAFRSAVQQNTPARIASPSPGSTLTSTTVTFQWTAGTGVSQYHLYVGTTGAGSSNLYNQSQGTNRSATVSGLPNNGSTVYVRLWSLIAGSWQSTDYTYKATGGAPVAAEITSPAPGSTLTSTTVTFQWSAGTGVTQYHLYVGSTGAGSTNLFNQSLGTNRSAAVSGLPNNGSTVYVRLWSLIAGSWQFKDYSYKAISAGPVAAAITSPAPGLTLTSTTVTFQWSAGTGITQYYLYVGSTQGGTNYYNQSAGTNRSARVSGLPANGSTVWVRLWSWTGSTWLYNDYSYSARRADTAFLLPDPPALADPGLLLARGAAAAL